MKACIVCGELKADRFFSPHRSACKKCTSKTRVYLFRKDKRKQQKVYEKWLSEIARTAV